jgi:glycosyltransferase involved in cell wall biosynthesis
VEADPRIVLVNETLSYAETLALKYGCDAYVSLHRSEGWGFGLIEAMAMGVAVVATAYSGNMEFCTPETAFLVDYKLTPVRAGDYAYGGEGQVWAEPLLPSAVAALRLVVSDVAERKRRGVAAAQHVRLNFGLDAVAKRYQARLDELLA